MTRLAQWRNIVLLALMTIVIALLSATAIVHRVWNHERAARTITRWASQSIAGELRLGRVDYPWWGAVRSLLGGPPVRIDVWDFAITDPTGRAVITAPHVSTGLRLNRLVFGKLHSLTRLDFVDAVIDQAHCDLHRLRDEGINLVAAFAHRPDVPTGNPKSKSTLLITVDKSIVVDGNFAMTFPKWAGRLDHFSLQHDQLRYSSAPDESKPGRPAFSFRIERLVAPRGEVEIGAQKFLLEHFVSHEFRAEPGDPADMFVAAQMRTHGALVNAHGKLTTVYGGHAGVDLWLEERHGQRLLAALPSRENLGGDVDANVHIHGPFSHTIIDGHANELELTGSGRTAKHVRANFRLDRGALALSDIAAEVFDGRVTGKADIALAAKKLDLDLELDGLHLSAMGKLAPLEVLLIAAAGTVRAVRLDKLAEDAHATVQWKGISATVYVRPKATFPHRLTMHGTL